MATTTENIRKLPGDLEFLTPLCPICAEHTDPDEAGFDCFGCGITWDKRGENPERIDPDAAQCPSLYAFVPDAVPCRCWRDAGHDGSHCNPDSFFSWDTANQTAEATP